MVSRGFFRWSGIRNKVGGFGSAGLGWSSLNW